MGAGEMETEYDFTKNARWSVENIQNKTWKKGMSTTLQQSFIIQS